MTSEREILYVFGKEYPAFDVSERPDFEAIIKMTFDGEFEACDLLGTAIENAEHILNHNGEIVWRVDGPISAGNSGPSKDNQLADRVRNYCLAAQTYWNWLNAVDSETFTGLLLKAKAQDEAVQLAKDLTDDVRAFTRNSLDDDGWLRWMGLPSWSAEEATALTLNVDPNIVTYIRVDNAGPRSLFRENYLQRLDFIRRAVRANELESDIVPSKFLSWAKSRVFNDIPDSMKRHFIALNELKGLSEMPSSQHNRKYNNLLRMFGAVLFSKFGVDPFQESLPTIPQDMIDSIYADFLTVQAEPVGLGTIGSRVSDSLKALRSRPKRVISAKLGGHRAKDASNE